MTDNELDQRLIASLTHLIEHLHAQSEHLERQNLQLRALPALAEQVERLNARVTSLTARLNG